ncbi:Major Facilitator Superfamily transporter [Mycobacteroides abscessus subsp. abscessus]|nr:Major Facilitator Superfamily transporter [Mycobacteroides abscessus subsp. abscessus]
MALYLLITIAPFAVIAPLIGPALDRLQHGRRAALAASFGLRTLLAVIMIANYDGASGSFPPWVLYPCALSMLVLSKSFGVLRGAVTPRVLPPTIDLVRVNSRLTTFGLVGGTIVGGAIAAGCELAFTRLLHLPGALFVVIAVTAVGAWASMRIPKWVEVTAGEVPTTFGYHGDDGEHPTILLRRSHKQPEKVRQPLGRNIITSLWGNSTIKVMVGSCTRHSSPNLTMPTASSSSPCWAWSVRPPVSATSRATPPVPDSSSAAPPCSWCAAPAR